AMGDFSQSGTRSFGVFDDQLRELAGDDIEDERIGYGHRRGVRGGRKSVDALVIAGATAGGKSARALGLAEGVGGVIVNADSMQVYRELRVLTARPCVRDEGRAPHRLYGHVSAREHYSVGHYVVDASRTLGETRSMGLPIFVGGTGLYFSALEQ